MHRHFPGSRAECPCRGPAARRWSCGARNPSFPLPLFYNPSPFLFIPISIPFHFISYLFIPFPFLHLFLRLQIQIPDPVDQVVIIGIRIPQHSLFPRLDMTVIKRDIAENPAVTIGKSSADRTVHLPFQILCQKGAGPVYRFSAIGNFMEENLCRRS